MSERPVRSPYRWRREISVAVDGLATTIAILIGLVAHHAARTDPKIEAAPLDFAAGGFAIATAAILLLRRTRPLLAVWLVVLIAIVAPGVIGDPGLSSAQLAFELVVLIHSAGSWSTRPRAATAVAVVVTVVGFLGAMPDNGVLGGGAFALTIVALPFAIGVAARMRREYLVAVEARLEQAERERDERARRAVLEDRAQLALELHDVVAHHVSLIGVQAGTARITAATDPVAANAALVAIEHSSRAAVGEIRRLLDTLDPRHGEASTPARAPVATLERIHELVNGWAAAGMQIELRGVGPIDSLPVDVSACAYRIIEEGLTNVARHSTANAARVEVVIGDRSLQLMIDDPGPPRAAAPDGEPGGRGLAGVARRVELFDGELDVGRRPDGGFSLRARLHWTVA